MRSFKKRLNTFFPFIVVARIDRIEGTIDAQMILGIITNNIDAVNI